MVLSEPGLISASMPRPAWSRKTRFHQRPPGLQLPHAFEDWAELLFDVTEVGVGAGQLEHKRHRHGQWLMGTFVLNEDGPLDGAGRAPW
jgi:hypothetical protein